MISPYKAVIVQRKLIDVENRIDAEFFDEEFTIIEQKLKNLPHFELGTIIKFRCIQGDSSRCFNPSKKPDEVFYYIDIANTSKKDGTIYPQELMGEEASPRARKIVKTNDIIVSTVRPNKNAVAVIYPDYDNYVCSTGFAVFEAIDVHPYLLFVFLKTEFSITQLIRRTRSTMYPAVNPDVDIPQLIVPKCIQNVEKTVVELIKKSIKHFQDWSSKLNEIDARIIKKFKIDSFSVPDAYQSPNIVNRKKLMTFANRCDAEFFDSFFDYLYIYLNENNKLIKLIDLVDDDSIYTGSTPAAKEYSDNETDPGIIKVKSLSNKGINWDDIEFIPENFLKSNKKFLIHEYDILLTSSAHSREHIAKKIDVIKNIPQSYKDRCITVGELMTIRLKKEVEINPYYIASFLRTVLGRLQIQRCIRGISAHIYPKDLQNFIYIPITDDQFMKEISTLVEESEKERNLGREYFFKAKKILTEEIKKNIA